MLKKSHYNYLSICVLFLTSIAQVDKEEGNTEHKKKEFRNVLGFYTKLIDVNCKNDQLNAFLHRNRATTHFSLGEFTRLFICRLRCANQNMNSPHWFPNASLNVSSENLVVHKKNVFLCSLHYNFITLINCVVTLLGQIRFTWQGISTDLTPWIVFWLPD